MTSGEGLEDEQELSRQVGVGPAATRRHAEGRKEHGAIKEAIEA